MIKILFPDSLHFHEKGFKSLIDLTKEKNIEPIYIDENDEQKALYGNYSDNKALYLDQYDRISDLSADELFNKSHYGASLFSLAKAELLTYLMTKENWFNQSVSSANRDLFDKAFEENKEDLLLNLSSAIYWLDFWRKVIKENKGVSFCIIFSGSLIYVKTLSLLLQNTSINVFVAEHFFTGSDYYFEEKYTHIANNSDVKFINCYKKLQDSYAENDPIEKSKDKIKAINKINLSKNRNVSQPKNEGVELRFNNTNDVVLILGQVINDFSVLETHLRNINTLETYKDLICRTIKETNYNIIFKSHPWEKSKANVKRSLTKEEIEKYVIRNFTDEEQGRIKIVEDYNIFKLFDISKHIVAICSQSLLEAAYYGRKTHQIGQAFFGGKGFTYDHSGPRDFVKAIANGRARGKLNLDEYDSLMEFFTIVLQYHLVSVFQSGKKRLRELLSSPSSNIQLVQSKTNSMLSPSKQAVALASGHKEPSLVLDYSQNKSIRKRLIDGLVISFSSDKKAEKFRSNPKSFFEDSSIILVQALGKLY